MNIDAGTRLGHYEIRSKIGEGGMGEVYLAEDLRLRRRVALKVLPPHLAADADRLHRFEREAFAASALNHPNILTIFEFGAEAQTHFLVAEFVEGLSLRQRLAGGPLPLPECLDMTIQIASALAAAHDAGIIHRDIKPDNVMVRADGYVKVLDFGLAKLAESGATGLKSDPEDQTLKQIQTRAGLVMGTAGYMSPEQARGLSVDKRSDIWSLGCVLYELLCGQTPFQGETITDTVANIIHREPASMLKLRPEANAELARIIGLCLTKNAAERYQSVRELLADLKQLQKRLELSELGHALGQSAPTEVHVAPVSNAGTNEAPAVATAAQSSPDQIRTLSQSKRRVTAIVVAVIAIAVLATVAVVVIGFYRSRSNPPALQSIAVMPFVNASGKPEVDYLSDGLTDSLIFRFSQLPEIKVSPTSSVMRFKGTAKDPAEIAKELEVDSVLSGRLMQTSDNLSISVQLIDTRTKKLVWAEQYDRKMADLMVTQREIATTVAQKMQLAGNERGVTKKYTNNNDAYQLYLKGRYHWSRRTPDDLAKAVDSYKQAIAIDANFALAYAALAEVYNSMGKQDVLPKDCIPLAKAAATRALEIDPLLPEAHSALADSLAIYDWDWPESERHFKRAFELDPNISYIHLAYGGSYLFSVGRMDQSVAEFEKALQLEPLSLITNAVAVNAYVYARQYDKALRQARTAFDLEPNFPMMRPNLGLALIVNGKYDEAISILQQVPPDVPGAWAAEVELAHAYAKQGKRAEAEQQISLIRAAAKTQHVRPYLLASIYASLGDKDNAFAELERAFAERDCYLGRISVDPFFDSLRDDPRFKDLLKRMNLPR